MGQMLSIIRRKPPPFGFLKDTAPFTSITEIYRIDRLEALNLHSTQRVSEIITFLSTTTNCNRAVLRLSLQAFFDLTLADYHRYNRGPEHEYPKAWVECTVNWYRGYGMEWHSDGGVPGFGDGGKRVLCKYAMTLVGRTTVMQRRVPIDQFEIVRWTVGREDSPVHKVPRPDGGEPRVFLSVVYY